MHERTPEEAADLALKLADQEALNQIQREGRQFALSAILNDGQYRVGALMARKMSFTEDKIHDLITEVSDIKEDDGYLAWEAAFGLDRKLLDSQ